MTNRIRDASKKSEVSPLSFGHLPDGENGRQRQRGRPKTEDQSRHGPSARGDPEIRGKPPDVYISVISKEERSLSNEVALDNMRFPIKLGMTIRGKSPMGVGTVISTRYEERSLSNEVALDNMRFPIKLGMTASGKPGSWLHRNSRALAAKNIVDEVGAFIPNGDYFGKEVGRKSQFSVAVFRKKRKRSQFSALKGRQAIAQCEALGLNEHTTQIVPRSTANYGDAIAWGKINNRKPQRVYI